MPCAEWKATPVTSIMNGVMNLAVRVIRGGAPAVDTGGEQ
jgi:hypothetical protein